MKHTPGPWKHHLAPEDNAPEWAYRFQYWVDSSGNVPIADIRGIGDPTTAANARLIAAAPDLLEACQYAFENLKPKGNVKKDFSGHNAMATLSRAIHKATKEDT